MQLSRRPASGLRNKPTGFCCLPPDVPRRHPEAADVPGGHPLRLHPPPMLRAALPAIGQPLRHSLEADTGGGTDLRHHGFAPDDHPVPARLSADEARPRLEKMPDAVPEMRAGEYHLLTRINRRSRVVFVWQFALNFGKQRFCSQKGGVPIEWHAAGVADSVAELDGVGSVFDQGLESRGV